MRASVRLRLLLYRAPDALPSNDGLEWLLTCPAFGIEFDSSAGVKSPRGRVLVSSREVGAAGCAATTVAGGTEGSDAAAEPSGTAVRLGVSVLDSTDGVGGFFFSQALRAVPNVSMAAITAAEAGREVMVRSFG